MKASHRFVPTARVMHVPASTLLAISITLAVSIMAIILLVIGIVISEQRLMETANQRANDIGTIIEHRAGRLIAPARVTLRQVGMDPLATSRSHAERMARMHVLYAELAANPLISAAYVGYDTGEFFLVRSLANAQVHRQMQAPTGAAYLVQSLALRDGRLEGRFVFLNDQGGVLLARPMPGYRFDPRQRPWYSAARGGERLGRAEVQMSSPYVFFTTQQLGITLSQVSRQGGAVVGVDLVLDELAAALQALKPTPASELVVLDAQNHIVIYPEVSQIVARKPDGKGFSYHLKSIEELATPVLQTLVTYPADSGHADAVLVESGGRTWNGVVRVFDMGTGAGYRLILASPVDELLANALARRRQGWLLAAGVALLLLPIGWFLGAYLGAKLRGLIRRAEHLGRFDFEHRASEPSLVAEINYLSGTMDDLSHTVQSFLTLSQSLATEQQLDVMLPKILEHLCAATRSDAAAVYLVGDDAAAVVALAAQHNPGGTPFAASLPYESADTPSAKLPAGISGIPLRGRDGDLTGLLLLRHDDDHSHQHPAFLAFTHKLSGMLAVSIETRQLIQAQRSLLDGVIRLMADAIDAKSPYTGGHCERVPRLAINLLDSLAAATNGPFAGYTLSDAERYEFYLAAWLHDCGKVTSPEHIVDKATKLELIYNRIHEIRTRFEVLWRDADIAYLHTCLGGGDAAAAEQQRLTTRAQLRSDFAAVANANIGGEFMTEASMARIQQIAQHTWVRHFDDRLGLSAEELRRMGKAGPADLDGGVVEQLLADKREHVVAWGDRTPPTAVDDPRNRYGFDMTLPSHQQNMGEVYNLCVQRGTLTEEDRYRINDHIVQTYIMLKGLPWPRHLAKVPELAATHHERLDGKGYPRKLPAERLTIPDRVMAIADVFEALTAADRPYKSAKTLTESLRIMALMCKDHHLDTAVFRYFLHSAVWQDYARQFLLPTQIDSVDLAALEALLPAA